MSLMFQGLLNEPTPPEFEIADEAQDIVSEVMIRALNGQTYYPKYKDLSWEELCDKGIELFQKLKENGEE